MNNILKAGRLFLWEAKEQPRCVNIPELISKVSVGPEHVVALGASGYELFNSAISIRLEVEVTENLVMVIQRIKKKQNKLNIFRKIILKSKTL
jgi:hypothetical protein